MYLKVVHFEGFFNSGMSVFLCILNIFLTVVLGQPFFQSISLLSMTKLILSEVEMQAVKCCETSDCQLYSRLWYYSVGNFCIGIHKRYSFSLMPMWRGSTELCCKTISYIVTSNLFHNFFCLDSYFYIIFFIVICLVCYMMTAPIRS